MFLRMTYLLKTAGRKITEGEPREGGRNRQSEFRSELYRKGNHRENLCGQSIHHPHVTAMGRDC